MNPISCINQNSVNCYNKENAKIEIKKPNTEVKSESLSFPENGKNKKRVSMS